MRLPACCCCRVKAGRPAESGVALITVLLIVFLASMTAVSLSMIQQIALRRSTVLQHQQQARLYTLGVEQWAGLILLRDRRDSVIDHPGEAWANLPPMLPVENGELSGKIRDLQGCFNLNNLWQAASGAAPEPPEAAPESQKPNPDAEKPPSPNPPNSPNPPDAEKSAGQGKIHPEQLKVLQRLLNHVQVNPELAQAIADWIDPDTDPLFPDGAEDSEYTVRNPPYLAANQPMLSISELRLIKGVDPEVYERLAALVCALPPGTPLNVNTAPAPVLAALDEHAQPADIERVLKERPAQGYQNVDEFLNAAQLTPDAPTKALLSTDSQYFLLQVEVRLGDGRAVLSSTLFRDENRVRVLRRSFGNPD